MGFDSALVRPGRLAAGVGLALAFLACGTLSLLRGLAWEDWLSSVRAGGVDFLRDVPRDEVPDEAAAFRQLAHLHGEQLVPPDRGRALEEIEAALARDPLRSELWILAARQQFFRGNRDAARAALAFSDELNPSFPLQRLKAVQLWELLGEGERARDIALSVARLDFEGKREAAEALRLLGMGPVETFLAVGGPECEPAQVARLLADLKSPSRETMRALFEQVPESAWRDAEFRKEAAGLAENPFLFAVAMRLWEAEEPEVRLVAPVAPGEDPSDIPAWNAGLSRNPFEGSTARYGWARPSSLRGVNWSWTPLEEEGAPRAAIQLRFRSHTGTPGREDRWRAYRIPVPPQPGGVVVRALVQLEPPLRSEVRLWARLGGGSVVSSAAASTEEEGWQVLSVELPPEEGPCVLEVGFTRRWRGSTAVEDALVRIGGLEFDAPEASP